MKSSAVPSWGGSTSRTVRLSVLGWPRLTSGSPWLRVGEAGAAPANEMLPLSALVSAARFGSGAARRPRREAEAGADCGRRSSKGVRGGVSSRGGTSAEASGNRIGEGMFPQVERRCVFSPSRSFPSCIVRYFVSLLMRLWLPLRSRELMLIPNPLPARPIHPARERCQQR